VTVKKALVPSLLFTSTVTSWRGVSAPLMPVIVSRSKPVMRSDSALWPALNCSGRTPMPTRFERWMRS